MNYYNTLIYTLIIIFSITCSKDNDKDKESPMETNKETCWTPSETVTLEKDNSIIQFKNITLTFELSNLDENYDIKLYEGEGGESFYQEVTTEIIGLEFLQEPEKDLTLKISLPIESNETKSIYYSLNDQSQSFSMNTYITAPAKNVEITGDSIKAEIILPFSQIQSLRASSSLKRRVNGGYIFGLFGGKAPERDSTAHFILEKPASNRTVLSSYLNYLEEAYEKLNNIGFPMDSVSPAAKGKIRCYIGDTGKNNQGESNLGMYYMISNHIYITNDESALSSSNAANIKAVLGHEFFHYVQYNHYISRASLSDSYSWLAEASAVWFEYLLDNPSRYVDVAITNCDFFQDGLEGKTSDDIDHHGYGASYFLKHLADTRGNQIIAEIWNKVKAQSYGQRVSSRAINACLQNYDTPLGIKSSTDHEMHEFMKAYVDSAINGIGHVRFSSLFPDENKFFIKDTNTLTFTSNYSYPDLSSQVYHCWLPSNTKSQFSDDVELDFEIQFSLNSSLFNCFIFDLNKRKLMKWVLGSDSPILIEDFKTNDELAVVVYYSNHALYYDSQKTNTTTLNVIKKEDNSLMELLHETSKIRFVIGGDHQGTEGKFNYYSDLQPRMENLSWNGNSFSTNYDTNLTFSKGTWNISESVTGNVSRDAKKLETITYSYSLNAEGQSIIGESSYPWSETKNISITLKEIDHNTTHYYSEDEVQYYVEGTECANHITISYTYQREDSDPYGYELYETYTHTNWDNADDYPRIFIIFEKED